MDEREPEAQPRTMQMMQDPRVTGFLRFLQTVMQAITLASVLGLASAALNWNTNMQRITYILEAHGNRIKEGENDINNLQRDQNQLKVDARVMEQNIRTLTWQFNNLMRQVGK
jgi:tRNA splicing ligase